MAISSMEILVDGETIVALRRPHWQMLAASAFVAVLGGWICLSSALPFIQCKGSAVAPGMARGNAGPPGKVGRTLRL